MIFTSPIWLWCLVPWALLTLWLLWGRPVRTNVPFLDLWPESDAQTRVKRSLRMPPTWLAFAIGAILLAILAAAGLMLLEFNPNVGPRVTVLLDGNITTYTRREAMLNSAAESIRASLREGEVDVYPVPDGPVTRSDREYWAAVAMKLPATTLDTRAAMESSVARELERTTGPVVVLSDKKPGIDDPRLIWFAPSEGLRNIGIVRLSLRQVPKVQLMVRLRNQSPVLTTPLVIHDGLQRMEHRIDLPPRDSERDYFFDIPNPGPTLRVEIATPDHIPADNIGWLAREGDWARIEPLTSLPPELGRMIEVYQKAYPPRMEARPVAVVGGLSQLPKDRPAAGVLTTQLATAVHVGAKLDVQAHPLTDHVDWNEAAANAAMAGAPEEVWTSLVSMGNGVLLAVREQPVRQVWVGFHSAAWPRSTDFVVFWTNVFNWLGQSGESYDCHPLSELKPGWEPVDTAVETARPWPGLYRNKSGKVLAFNLMNMRIPSATEADWRSRAGEQNMAVMTAKALRPWLAAGAIACLVVTLAASRKRRLTPLRRSRTV